jgi:hypothetical protein
MRDYPIRILYDSNKSTLETEPGTVNRDQDRDRVKSVNRANGTHGYSPDSPGGHPTVTSTSL